MKILTCWLGLRITLSLSHLSWVPVIHPECQSTCIWLQVSERLTKNWLSNKSISWSHLTKYLTEVSPVLVCRSMAPSRTWLLFMLPLSLLSGWLSSSDHLPHGHRMAATSLSNRSTCINTQNKKRGQGAGISWQENKRFFLMGLFLIKEKYLPESTGKVPFTGQNRVPGPLLEQSLAKKAWIIYDLFSYQIRVLLTSVTKC